jgi:rare lipoprotein A
MEQFRGLPGMTERQPSKSGNLRATSIALASLAALLVAVALAQSGLIPQKLEARDKAGPATVVPANLPADTSKALLPKLKTKTGEASWYDFNGKKTANGETMDPSRLTAAHPTLPFGTKVEVENVENGRTVVVRVNDRGPYAEGRIIDVSKGAARKLGMVEDGVTDVNVAPVPTDSVDDPGEPIVE